jgi:hypothetical protein
MKLLGKARREFDLQQDTLVQTAHFIPHGFWGRLSWNVVYPLHYLVFPSLCRSISEQASTLSTNESDITMQTNPAGALLSSLLPLLFLLIPQVCHERSPLS